MIYLLNYRRPVVLVANVWVIFLSGKVLSMADAWLAAGRWSTCRRRHGNCGAGGTQTRRVSCMLGDDGLMVSESLCDGELKPPSYRACFVVCDHHRLTYRWSVGDWTPCQTTALHNACATVHDQPQVPVASIPPKSGIGIGRNFSPTFPTFGLKYFFLSRFFSRGSFINDRLKRGNEK